MKKLNIEKSDDEKKIDEKDEKRKRKRESEKEKKEDWRGSEKEKKGNVGKCIRLKKKNNEKIHPENRRKNIWLIKRNKNRIYNSSFFFFNKMRKKIKLKKKRSKFRAEGLHRKIRHDVLS